MKYYTIKNILEKNAHYNVIFGERSSGKTYSVYEYGLKNYYEHKKQMALVRRWQEDFTGKRGMTMFDNVTNSGAIKKITHGEWSGVYYHSSRWYLCRYENNERIADETPFAYGFSISAMEHDKSVEYPNITTILFDEFITRSVYLPDEFKLFSNVLSTIIRLRKDVKIFMLGNTVNQYCPYFNEMGLKHVREMKQGDIDVYRYGESDLTVAVEYAAPISGKENNFYFAFDNPKLNMIKSGAWEIDIYPHCPCKYTPNEILFVYFIIFNSDVLQCEIIQHNDLRFTFIHPKTGDIKDIEHDTIFTPEFSPRPNYHRKITNPKTPLERRIADFFVRDKVFYATNETGEIVRNYLLFCKS